MGSTSVAITDDDAVLNVGEFMEAIFRFSQLRFLRATESRSESWARFLDMYLRPHAIALESELGVEKNLSAAIAVVESFGPQLEAVFASSCAQEGIDNSEAPAVMGIGDYLQLIGRAHLLDAKLTRLETKRAFHRAQNSLDDTEVQERTRLKTALAKADPRSAVNSFDAVDDDGYLRELDYEEFKTSLVFLASFKYDSGRGSDAPLEEKTRQIVSKVCMNCA